MRLLSYFLSTTALLILCIGCKDSPGKSESDTIPTVIAIDSIKIEEEKRATEIQKDTFRLTEENAIDFFFKYQQNLKTTKVRMTTNFGSFVIQLYDNVPYHKANFIYLTEKGYFDYTQFHRVVKDFIIQGGNSDDKKTVWM